MREREETGEDRTLEKVSTRSSESQLHIKDPMRTARAPTQALRSAAQTDKTSKKKQDSVVALQALSTFFVADHVPIPGENYTNVTLRTLAAFIDRDPGRLRETLLPLATAGFCEVTDFEARLTPGTWANNKTQWSRYLAHFVSNAPASLRNADTALLPVNPLDPVLPQPRAPHGSSVTVTSNFGGTYSSYQEEYAPPPQMLGPYEVAAPWYCRAQPTTAPSSTLAFLRTKDGLLFRNFLAAASLTSTTATTLYGDVSVTLVEYMDMGRCLVLTPSDNLDASHTTPMDFVANIKDAAAGDFEDPSKYPLQFKATNGVLIEMRANGILTVDKTRHYRFQLLGASAGGAYMVALVDTLQDASLLDVPLQSGVPTAPDPCS